MAALPTDRDALVGSEAFVSNDSFADRRTISRYATPKREIGDRITLDTAPQATKPRALGITEAASTRGLTDGLRIWQSEE